MTCYVPGPFQRNRNLALETAGRVGYSNGTVVMKRFIEKFGDQISVFLISSGIVALMFSLFVSDLTKNGEWFQRSGSLLVLFCAIVEIIQNVIKEPQVSSSVYIEGRPALKAYPISSFRKFLHSFSWVGIVLGTIVWGYGDLVFV